MALLHCLAFPGGVRGRMGKLTIELLEDSLHGTGTAAAAHGDVELVLMIDHRVSFGKMWSS